jgi:uncharacterized membrane protein YeaQ/YmgE (transglycosylase-associated protein family)
MTASVAGLVAGVLLAIAALIGGWSGFALAVLFGFIGALVAGQLSGELDLTAVTRGRARG